jgi:hypothetical protein
LGIYHSECDFPSLQCHEHSSRLLVTGSAPAKGRRRSVEASPRRIKLVPSPSPTPLTARSATSPHPASESPRSAQLELSGLRVWPLKRFPDLVFYFEREDRIDVVRVLHGKRDLAAWLARDLQT